MPLWKRLVTISVSAGAGFAVMLALVAGAVLWYISRPKPPKPWNTNAIKATFDRIDLEGGSHTLDFYYVLENTTDSDCRLDESAVILLKLRKQGMSKLSVPMTGDFPLLLPARHRISFGIHIQRPYDPAQLSDQDLEDLRRLRFEYASKNPNDPRIAKIDKVLVVASLVGSNPNLDGFVLFDEVNRYEIDFPNGWELTPATSGTQTNRAKESTGEKIPDPLGLYGPYNPALAGCLRQVNPKDPLGLFTDDPVQAKRRKACSDLYKPK